MIAVDSNVLIDFIGNDSAAADAADEALRRALGGGPVVACDIVVAELVTGLGQGSAVIDALEELGIEFLPLELRSAVRAGEMQRRYRERRATAVRSKAVVAEEPLRVVADFLIGAHALLQCQALITRDAGFFRDYFKGLKIIVPEMRPPSSLALATPQGGRPPTARQSRIRGGKLGRAQSTSDA